MSRYFTSRYPIIEAAMNGVSDLPLALACWDAGIFPNLFLQDLSEESVYTTLSEFVKITKSSDLIFCIPISAVLHNRKIDLIKQLKSFNVSHIEVLPSKTITEKINPKIVTAIYSIMHPMKVMRRATSLLDESMIFNNVTYCLKGSDAAGMNNGNLTTKEFFSQQKLNTPNVNLIPYGGIGTPKQVADYINAGAIGVAVGTLLAASKESPLSTDAKLALVSSTTDNITKFADTGQNALILGDQNSVLEDLGDWNRSTSLRTGLTGNGKEGHVYAGTGINYITDILPVKEIVRYLVSELSFPNPLS
jgi:hypothetical protein